MNKKLATVLVVIENGKILLGMKKRGFGVGRWNGFGGKPDGHETIEETAIRETKEECGILVKNIVKVGILDFEFANKSEWNQQVHFFVALQYDGQPFETEEMKPGWFDFDKIPFEKMWPDDKFWIPIVLENKKFQGKFVFGEGDEVLQYVIEEVDSL